jgi:Eco57I restriction-modification methylase
MRRRPLTVLPVELRNKLERTIVEARDVAEAGAKVALEAFAVHHYEPYGHMSPEERRLRNHLRARARQLGDKQNQRGELDITHLVWECAYEHWHRMLFARFLAENELLIEPDMGVAISLEECEELAKEDGKDLWTLASEFAQQMLPQIFRPDDPVLRVSFASEHRLKLENLLNDMEPVIFTDSDSLGWIYQFWQTKRKKEINESEIKIGPDELPAVTQLFTEPYMVNFLLENSLGAWWADRRLKEPDFKTANSEEELRKKISFPGVPLKYTRFIKMDNGTWTPAAGTFDGWPEHLSELKTLDPCCGSGHFLVTAFLMLVPMRMALEGLSAHEAVDAVLRENIHGLELDKRCVELAAFALALTAWCYPDAGGYRQLPELNLACSGLAISAKKEEWLNLAGDNKNLRMALEELYKQFKKAPVLGSLINPEIGLAKGSLFELKWEEVGLLLTKALAGEKGDEKTEMGVVAQGITKAASLLTGKYNWVITNVPYLKRGNQCKELQDFIDLHHIEGRGDLATAFLNRCIGYCKNEGNVSVVLPQNWLFLTSYQIFREKILKEERWNLISRLGPGAFETISGEVVKAILVSISKRDQNSNIQHTFSGIDVSMMRTAREKATHLITAQIKLLGQRVQLSNPDSRIIFDDDISELPLLETIAESGGGVSTFDSPRFIFQFWELGDIDREVYIYCQTAPSKQTWFSGRNQVLKWEHGNGDLYKLMSDKKDFENYSSGIWKVWSRFVGKKGVCVGMMNDLPATLYDGYSFDNNTGVIIPQDEEHLPAIWCLCSSLEYNEEIRKIDQKLNVTSGTLVKIPFDFDHWTKVAQKKYPNGLPKPYSDDPTQWIFHGHPAQSIEPLQVAVARLLGYRWLAELDTKMELNDDQQGWITKCDVLLDYIDKDGIVCIPSVRGEEPAADRLRELIATSYGPDWSPAIEQELIHATETSGTNFNDWLRDHFFEQHCKLFYHRPFIWHIWDGRRRDGFHALVNYHKLAEGNGMGRQLLENLTYSYLGDWITRQKEGVKRGEGGAEDRLAAAVELQKRLIAIIVGEPPFDIFVRWKPIEEQPIGWEPNINDGVRLNIRPFMTQDIPGGKKGAGILRWKPNIKWSKDRGKEPFRPKEQYPWSWKDGEFTGDRVNDIHLTNEKKRIARQNLKE